MSEPREFTKYPYQVQFPHSSERYRNCQTLEDALWWAQWHVHGRRSEADEYGAEGELFHPDVEVGIITNRNSGYRWIVRRERHEVEFETSQMVDRKLASISLDMFLTFEEGEALIEAAQGAVLSNRRTNALRDQAVDQISFVCRQLRRRALSGDEDFELTRPMNWRRCCRHDEAPEESTALESVSEPKVRENMTLAECAEILGKAKSTLSLWIKKDKFPPAIDLAPFWNERKPRVVVPRDRFEAWQRGDPMPKVIEQVFEMVHLKEPPFVAWTPRRDATADEIERWVARRSLARSASTKDRPLYGYALVEGQGYTIEPAGERLE